MLHVVKHSSPHLLYLDFICLAPQITASREVFPLVLFTAATRELVSSRETCSGNPGQNLGEIVMSSDLKPFFFVVSIVSWHPETCVTQPVLKESCTVFPDFSEPKDIFINQKLSFAQLVTSLFGG